MIEPEPTADEARRLGVLHRLGLLDGTREERFDRYVRLAQRLFDVPMAMVSLVDEHEQVLKASVGLQVVGTPRSVSFCGHAIHHAQVMVVPDATQDERFHDNPLVAGDPNIRFYAGFPLEVGDGQRIGTLCVVDDNPRDFSPADVALLQDLGRMVTAELQDIDQDGIDPLTGLSGPQTFRVVARSVIANARRTATRVTLALFGLDGLGDINRTHGYDAGDKALVLFGGILSSTVRDSDVVARLGSSTFAVLLTGCDGGTAAQVIGRVGRRLHQATHDEQVPFTLDYSLGLATLNLGRVDGLDLLVQQAQDQLGWDRKDRAA